MNATLENNKYIAEELHPYHGVQDREKFDELVLSMVENGWVGAPLVKYGNQLLTGSHRFAAAKASGTPVMVVDLMDVFCIDEEDLLIALSWDCWEIEVTRLAREDNAEIFAELGMDIC
jgi:ParB-like nuclease domain